MGKVGNVHVAIDTQEPPKVYYVGPVILNTKGDYVKVLPFRFGIDLGYIVETCCKVVFNVYF